MRTTSLSRTAALFRAALLCGVLSACGGGGGTPEPVAPPAPAPAPAPAPGPLAYIIHFDKVEVCQISGSDLVDCAGAGVPELQDLQAMAVSGSNAYFANGESASIIVRCRIGSAGTLSECVETGPTDLQGTRGLTVHGSTLYISDSGSGRVRRCAIQPDGLLAGCANAGFPDDLASAAADLEIVGSKAYVLHSDEQKLSRCDVLGGGFLDNCADAAAAGLNDPLEITVSGDHIYAVNGTGSTVIRCVIDTNSALTDCRDAGATGLGAPRGVAVRGSSVYIANANPGVGLTRCTAAADGLLSNCTSIPGSMLYRIVFR